jgi:hypothetical protein
VAAGGLGAHAYAGRLVGAFLVALKDNDTNGTLVKTMTAGLRQESCSQHTGSSLGMERSSAASYSRQASCHRLKTQGPVSYPRIEFP